MNCPRVAPITAVLAALSLAAAAPAQQEAKPKQNGFTVTIELRVDDKGDPQEERIVETEDRTPDHVLEAMALIMAAKTKYPPHLKEGKPVKFNVRAPFFFPIEGDEGPAADALPRPKVKEAVQPVYPAELREANIVGGAILELNVDAEGKLTSVKSLRASHVEFERSALESVNKWQFAPAQKDGQAVPSRVRLAIVFDTQDIKADLKWRVPPRPSLATFIVIKPDPISRPTEPTVPAPLAPASPPAMPQENPAPGK